MHGTTCFFFLQHVNLVVLFSCFAGVQDIWKCLTDRFVWEPQHRHWQLALVQDSMAVAVGQFCVFFSFDHSLDESTSQIVHGNDQHLSKNSVVRLGPRRGSKKGGVMTRALPCT